MTARRKAQETAEPTAAGSPTVGRIHRTIARQACRDGVSNEGTTA